MRSLCLCVVLAVSLAAARAVQPDADRWGAVGGPAPYGGELRACSAEHVWSQVSRYFDLDKYKFDCYDQVVKVVVDIKDMVSCLKK